jgi:hypothetical protein
VINNSDKQVGLYSRVGLYSGGGAYIWNEVSVSTSGTGLIYGALIFGGGAYIRRFTVYALHATVHRSMISVND